MVGGTVWRFPMFGLRAPELLLIFAVLLLLFGAKKLPALGASLGSSIRNFKKGFGSDDEVAPTAETEHKPASLSASQGPLEGSRAAATATHPRDA